MNDFGSTNWSKMQLAICLRVDGLIAEYHQHLSRTQMCDIVYCIACDIGANDQYPTKGVYAVITNHMGSLTTFSVETRPNNFMISLTVILTKRRE